MLDYSIKSKGRNHVWFKSSLLGGLLLLLFFVAFSVYAYYKINKPRTSDSRPQNFSIESGESLKSVAGRLEEEGIVSSSFFFYSFAKLSGVSGRVQAGTFELDSDMSPREILDIFVNSKDKADTVRIRFSEGWNNRQYAQAFENSGMFSSEEFLVACAEAANFSDYDFLKDTPAGRDLQGFLFPDTYDFRLESSPSAAVAKILSNFAKKLTPQLRQKIREQGRTVYDVVTLASLIEGEVGRNLSAGQTLSEAEAEVLAGERRLVAGVFYNRLQIGMPLQSDATVSYITGQKKARSTIAETQIDNPYNTYKYAGLPPGPINNPSLDSILAAIEPADTDYFYFLSKPSGEMVFAKTLEGHNMNKTKYLE